jgi:hypothetical protein
MTTERHVSGVGIVVALAVVGLVILPAVFLTAVFIAPVVLLVAPVMIAWALARGGAARVHTADDAHNLPTRPAQPEEPVSAPQRA